MGSIGSRCSGLFLALATCLAPGLSLASPAVADAGGPDASGVGPWATNAQARVRLVAARAAPGPGDPPAEIDLGVDLGLEFELEPGWHVYWKNSGDAGYPPKIDFSRSPALAGAELLFPAPRRYDLPGGLVSFGYEGQVIYPIAPRIPAPVGEASPVLARLDYLVCRMECVPHTAELALDLAALRAGSESEGVATAARLAAAREALPREPGAVPGAPEVSVRVEPAPASSLRLVFSARGGSLRAARPDLFFEVHPFFALERPELTISDDGLLFRVPFRALDETKPMPATTRFAWTLTGLERALAKTDSTRSEGSEPPQVALAGSASVEIPHLRTSDSRPTAGLRPGLVLPLLVAALFLAFFALHRSRHRRS